jgi:hypothetical protein
METPSRTLPMRSIAFRALSNGLSSLGGRVSRGARPASQDRVRMLLGLSDPAAGHTA